MSLPKEPRQKMINLMYLVLTALLALNVSSEILNAFKTVDKSLITANGIVEKKDKSVMESFRALAAKQETKEKAAIWMPKAEIAEKMTNVLYGEIEALKKELKEEAGLGKSGKNDKGEDLFKEDDLEAATRLFGEKSDHGPGKGKGKELKDKLDNFKKKLLEIDPEIGKQFANSLPISTEVPEGKDWSDVYFHMTPTVAALTILSKFENDIKNSASQVIEYCHQQVGHVEVVYDQFQAIASQSSEYLMPGMELRITAGVGAFSKAAQPTVSVDGSSVPLNVDGVAEQKFNVGGAGAYSKKVTISFKKPDGTIGTTEKEIKYTVGSPTGVNVSATKVNVLYRDLDNPVAITGGSKGAEAIQATIDNGSMTTTGGGIFSVKPGAANVANINVTVDGKSTSFKFPVKRVPDPTPKVGPSAGGSISATSFKAQAGIRADMNDFVFEGIKFNVVKYTIICTGKGFENTGPKYKIVDGAYFDTDVKSFLDICRAGSSVLIQDIWVEGPGGRRKLESTMAFSLGN